MRGSTYDMPVVLEAGGVSSRQAEWGEMNVALERFPAGLDTTPLFKGLPDDRCQCPHWGYILKGRIRVKYADRDEILNAGDAYYLAPGHTAIFEADTEVVEFSPKGGVPNNYGGRGAQHGRDATGIGKEHIISKPRY